MPDFIREVTIGLTVLSRYSRHCGGPMWSQFKALLPSIGVYFCLSIFLCFCAWLFLKKVYASFHFPKYLPFGFAILMTLHFTGQNLISKPNFRNPAAVSGTNVVPAPVDMQKMRTDFLNTLDAVLNNPQQVTVQMKTDIFNRYGGLFATPEVKKAYEQNIGAIYACQKSFFEDALASLKTKKATKSETRKRCYEMDGKFFGREKLIPAELVKVNEEMIEKVSKGKPIKQGDKEAPANEKMFQDQVTSYNMKVQTVHALFN